jgi:hypothetical protein
MRLLRSLPWLLAALLGGCAPRAKDDAPERAPEAAASSLLPRPYRARVDAAVRENEGCVSCHDDVAEEWRASLHQRASRDPAYRAALELENSPFCRGCHAPESDPRAENEGDASALGVACVTCHVPAEGIVLAARHGESEEAESAPHTLLRSAEFAGPGACAACHEFRFPARHGETDEDFMQTTVREHARSAAAERPCAECHMPLRSGRRSHAFSSVRDPEYLRAALQIDLERVDREHVRWTLKQRDPGHAFPTGDLFRRLTVGATLLDAEGRPIRREERHLTRHFERVEGRPERALVRDDRLQGAPVSVELELLPPPGGGRPTTLRAFVAYQRVAAIGDGLDPSEVTVESEVLLHERTFAWENAR